ncbi:MAG TPA: kelch repeat-containing protein, partial [Planctomycetota bacterium]|nr:kelch repeat-containing protein [Planctomycetota bacterium]
GQFAPGPTLSEQRSGPALAPFSQAGIARVLIAGGEHGNVASRTAEVYLVDSNTLSPVAASMVEGRFDANAVTLVSGTTILLQGGWSASGGGAVPASSEIYDVSSQTFSPTPSVVSRAESTLVAVGSSTYAVGGTDGTNVLGSVEVFDGSTWSPASLSLLVARRAHTATALHGQILVAGGYDLGVLGSASLAPVSSSALGSTEILGNGAAAGLQAGRAYHTATALSNGELVVIGGQDGPAILASIEVYGANTTPTPAGSTVAGSTAATSSSSKGAKNPGQSNGNGNGQNQNAQGQNGGNGHPALPATGAPGISQVSPGQAAPGQAINIQGIGFDPTAANDTVVIGGANATVLTAAVNPSHDQLQVTIPATLKPGVVTITVTVGGKTSSAVNFTVR